MPESKEQRDKTSVPPTSLPSGGVLLVGPMPPEPHTGGIEIGVSMLLRSSVAQQHRMRLFNTARRRDPSRSMLQRIAFQLGAFARLIGAIARQRPDVVHVKASWGGVNFAQNICYSIIARLLGRRVLLQLHGGAFDSWYNSRTRLGRFGVRFGLSTASEIVVLSQYWREMVGALVPGTPITIVPNGVEVDNALPWTGSGSDAIHVLTIGAIGYRKGQFDIVKAAAELTGTPVRFILAGPPETADIDREIHALVDSLAVSDQIDFIGPIGREEKWRRLAVADVFLLPSYGENMPNGILEAMAAALPIITTPVGAVPEMVEHEQGALFVDCGDIEALAAAVRRLAGDAKLRARMAARNRADCEARFAFERIAEQFDRLYRRSGSDVPERTGIPRVAGVADSVR